MATLYKLPELKQHPIAIKLMPGGMDEDEFKAFCDDVAERGILFPATLYEGKILDGMHRYRAAEKTGSKLDFIEYKGKDPAGYIAAVNVLRRKLSSLQRALVGARLHREHGLSQRDVCKKLGISNEVLSMVLKAMDSKNTRIIKRIEAEGDYSRGMLREELTESGILTTKQKPERTHSASTPNSAFDLARASGAPKTPEQKELEYDMPDKGSKNSHPERKSKKTEAQRMAEWFRSHMEDEQMGFLELVWHDVGALFKARGIDLKCVPEGDKSMDQEVKDAAGVMTSVKKLSFKNRLDGRAMKEPSAEDTAKIDAIVKTVTKAAKADTPIGESLRKAIKGATDEATAQTKRIAKAKKTKAESVAAIDELLGKKAPANPLDALKAAVAAASSDLLAPKTVSGTVPPSDEIPTVAEPKGKKQKKVVDGTEGLL